MPASTFRLLVASLGLAALFSPTCASTAGDARGDDDPRVRLRLSGHLEGRLEPCGCASGQLGGLARRSFTLQQDRGYDVALEGGNLITGSTPLDEEKLITALTVLSDARAPYAAVALGPRDLALDTGLLGSFFEGFGLPLVTSDLTYTPPEEGEPMPWPALPAVRVDVTDENGVSSSLAIASLTRATSLGRDLPDGFSELAADAAWERALAAAPDATFRILFVHGDRLRATCTDLAESLVPRPHLVVGVGADVAEPALVQIERTDSLPVPLVFPGTRGRHLVDITLARRPDASVQVTDHRVIALAGSTTVKGAMESPDVRQLLLQHRNNVRDAGLRERMAEQHPTANGARYVGDATCAGCHATAHEAWSKTAHAHAWQTLVDAEAGDRYGWPVTHYPDCVSCHVVGYGEKSGFVNPTRTPGLTNVACETCHGPGGDHLAAPTENGFPDLGPETCQRCHDYEQSPDFEWNEYWGRVGHGLEPWMAKQRENRERSTDDGK
jgi:hypothetical protein